MRARAFHAWDRWQPAPFCHLPEQGMSRAFFGHQPLRKGGGHNRIMALQDHVPDCIIIGLHYCKSSSQGSGLRFASGRAEPRVSYFGKEGKRCGIGI